MKKSMIRKSARRNFGIAAVAAAALVLAACSSDEPGSAESPSVTTSSMSTSSVATTAASSSDPATNAPGPAGTTGSESITSDSASEPPTSMSSSDDDPSTDAQTTDAQTTDAQTAESSTHSSDDHSTGSITPVQLDEQSIAWMTALCTDFGSISDKAEAIDDLDDDNSGDPGDLIGKYVVGFNDLGSRMSALAGILSGLEPPTFTGGDRVAEVFIGALSDYSTVLADKATELSSVNANDPAAAKAAVAAAAQAYDDFDDELGDRLNDLTQLSPQEQAAIVAIPACSRL